MMAKSVQTELRSSRRPAEIGDFIAEGPWGKRKRLVECPICALDPDRDRYVFAHESRREAHFLNDHEADDIGRPMTELLAEMDHEERRHLKERDAFDLAFEQAATIEEEGGPDRRSLRHDFLDRFEWRFSSLLRQPVSELRPDRPVAADGGDRPA